MAPLHASGREQVRRRAPQREPGGAACTVARAHAGGAPVAGVRIARAGLGGRLHARSSDRRLAGAAGGGAALPRRLAPRRVPVPPSEPRRCRPLPARHAGGKGPPARESLLNEVTNRVGLPAVRALPETVCVGGDQPSCLPGTELPPSSDQPRAGAGQPAADAPGAPRGEPFVHRLVDEPSQLPQARGGRAAATWRWERRLPCRATRPGRRVRQPRRPCAGAGISPRLRTPPSLQRRGRGAAESGAAAAAAAATLFGRGAGAGVVCARTAGGVSY